MTKKNLTYKDAGVDIQQADQFVSTIKKSAQKTNRPGMVSAIGGFGALFEIPPHYQHPVLVSGTDGVGTKLKIAIECNDHSGIGIDLVAMCANDILCQGAEPLYFLDYFATEKINDQHAATIIESIANGCQQAGAALIGGETAEMPGLYQPGDYDLAGFCVGVVEKYAIIDGSKITAGDCIIGLASSGPHANGFSLIRKVLEMHQINLNEHIDKTTIATHLLAPTKIYVKPILPLLKNNLLHGLAHITGGGLLENIPRILPPSTGVIIDTQKWQIPTLFKWLQKKGNINTSEMFRTFNMGIGMILVTAPEKATEVLTTLAEYDETAFIIGEVTHRTKDQPTVILS